MHCSPVGVALLLLLAVGACDADGTAGLGLPNGGGDDDGGTIGGDAGGGDRSTGDASGGDSSGGGDSISAGDTLPGDGDAGAGGECPIATRLRGSESAAQGLFRRFRISGGHPYACEIDARSVGKLGRLECCGFYDDALQFFTGGVELAQTEQQPSPHRTRHRHAQWIAPAAGQLEGAIGRDETVP